MFAHAPSHVQALIDMSGCEGLYLQYTSLEIPVSPPSYWIRQRAIKWCIGCKIKVKHGQHQTMNVQITPALENEVYI